MARSRRAGSSGSSSWPFDRELKYFTARVSGASDSGAPARQQVYLNALRTLPEVEVHFGSFLAKTIWRPLSNLPVAGERIGSTPPMTLVAGNYRVTGSQAQILPVGSYPPRGGQKRRQKSPRPLPDAVIAEVHTMEEKGSDVNLASHLLNDAWKGLFEVAAVFSNDTDLVTPIRMVTTERRKVVNIVCPGRWQAAPKLVAVATHYATYGGRCSRQRSCRIPFQGRRSRNRTAGNSA